MLNGRLFLSLVQLFIGCIEKGSRKGGRPRGALAEEKEGQLYQRE